MYIYIYIHMSMNCLCIVFLVIAYSFLEYFSPHIMERTGPSSNIGWSPYISICFQTFFIVGDKLTKPKSTLLDH